MRKSVRKTKKDCKIMVFTLVELLVVIAIFMVLAALLFPALAKAKERFGGMVCMNQQKQIFLGGFMMYAQDYNGWSLGNYYAKFGCDTKRVWTQFLFKNGGVLPGLGYFPHTYGDAKILGSEKIFWCPTAVAKGPSLDPALYGSGDTTYLMNSCLASSGAWACPWKYDIDRGVFRVESILNPSSVAWLMDSISYQGSSLFSVYPFHNDANNVLFVDGHGKNMKLRSIYLNTNYPYKGANSY